MITKQGHPLKADKIEIIIERDVDGNFVDASLKFDSKIYVQGLGKITAPTTVLQVSDVLQSDFIAFDALLTQFYECETNRTNLGADAPTE